MNNHNLVIFDLDELYKILLEIKKHINFNFEKVNKLQLSDLDLKTNYLILTKKEIAGLENQIILDKFPVSIFKLLEKINIEFIKKNFHEQSEIFIGNYRLNLNSREMFLKENKLKLTLIILSIIVLFLVVTGRAHWLYASIVALIPLARKIMFIFRFIPLFKKFYSSKSNNTSKVKKMSKIEAANILNVSLNASKEEIIKAHKKAIQKAHPDKGGNIELAKKINEAKDVLIG